MDLVAFDHFDLFAHCGYREKVLTRPERDVAYLGAQAPWFDAQPADTATVARQLHWNEMGCQAYSKSIHCPTEKSCPTSRPSKTL